MSELVVIDLHVRTSTVVLDHIIHSDEKMKDRQTSDGENTARLVPLPLVLEMQRLRNAAKEDRTDG